MKAIEEQELSQAEKFSLSTQFRNVLFSPK